MYASYFGLREKPFSLTPDPRFYYDNPVYRSAYGNLLAGIANRKGIVLLVGEKGTGKTTLLRKLMAELDDSVRCFFFSEARLTVQQLYEFVDNVLGLKPGDGDGPAKLQALDRYLRAPGGKAKTTVFLIDEAQNAAPDALEALAQLLSAEGPGQTSLQIVLAGQPALESRLLATKSWRLKRGLSRPSRLEPLTADETAAYLDHRLAIAGNDRETVFTGEAARLIAAHACGIPRMINLFADKALAAAERNGKLQVSALLIETVARDLNRAAAAEPPARGAAIRARAKALARPVGATSLRLAATSRLGTLAGAVTGRLSRPSRAQLAWVAGSGGVLALVAMLATAIGQVDGDRSANVELRTRISELTFELRSAEDQAQDLDVRLAAEASERLALVSLLADAESEIGRLRLAGSGRDTANTAAGAEGTSKIEAELAWVQDALGRSQSARKAEAARYRAREMRISELGELRRALEVKLAAATQTTAALEAENADIQAALSRAKLASGPGQPAPELTKTGDLAAELAAAKLRHAELKATAAGLQKRLSRAQEALQGRSAELAKVHGQHVRLAAALAVAERARTESAAETAILRLALEQAERADRKRLRPVGASQTGPAEIKRESSARAGLAAPTTNRPSFEPAANAGLKAAGPAQPKPAPRRKVDHARRLAALMRQAKDHVAARRLTTPAKVNALDTYRHVLQLAPGHRPAIEGIDALKAQYLKWATAAEKKHEWINTLSYYEKALAIDPNDNAVKAKLRKIKNRARRAAARRA